MDDYLSFLLQGLNNSILFSNNNLDLKPIKPLDINLLRPTPKVKGINVPEKLNSFVKVATDKISDKISDKIIKDDELGYGLGTLFSLGVSSTTSTLANNLIKGQSLLQGLEQNTASSLAGAGAGLAANYIGQGINSLGGDSMLSRGIGQGIATGLGTLGGTALSGALSGIKVGKNVLTGGKGALAGLKSINPYGLGMSVVGTGLQAAFGPSKEYQGTYGNVTKTMDSVYDAVQAGLGVLPGGQIFSGALALNKGLSNLFGSTSGMTRQDAFLGSAFMPAPVKWLNMAGAKTTDSFRNQSWLNKEKTDTFMGNAFGNLGSRFDLATKESNKTYGTASRKAYNKALDNLLFANNAYETILDMADLNELQNIRSLYMSSINNQRYALSIQGGFNPIYVGKQGMKILNNATNHNMGMRLLSAAALIDNKQMILSAQTGTKVLYDPDWSDKLEPYAAGIGLAGDAVGLGAAATGVGIPVGTAIAGFANIPNLIIDGYQTARDTWRSFNDGGNSLGSAVWNGGELLLDAVGLKTLQYINKAQRAGVAPAQVYSNTERKAAKPYGRVGTGVGRRIANSTRKRKSLYNAGRRDALNESNEYLAKRGVRVTQGEYYYQKLADEMAKRGYGVAVNDAIKSANRTLRLNLAGISTISSGTNIYHLNK